MLALALLAVVLILSTGGLLFHLELKDRRHGQTVQALLQRIQDPVAAVAQHAVQAAPQVVTHLPFDDDDAWRKYAEELVSGDGD